MTDGSASAFSVTEIADQVRLTRTRAGGTGHLLYNTTTTLKKFDGAVVGSLGSPYATRALRRLITEMQGE